MLKEEEGLLFSCSEKKDPDQIHSYLEADLRLLFSHMQIFGFPIQRFIFNGPVLMNKFFVYRMSLCSCLG